MIEPKTDPRGQSLGPAPSIRSTTVPEASPLVPQEGMWDVHVPPGNVAYFRSVWERRDYMGYAASNELRSRQMNSVLGNLWHLINPMLQIAVYFVIFGVVLGVDRGENYFVFLSIGIFVFGFTQRSTTSGANSINNNKGLLNVFSFPRALLPVTSTLTETLATFAPIVVMYVVALLNGEVPNWTWLLLIPLMGVQLVFNLGWALVAARATSSVRTSPSCSPSSFDCCCTPPGFCSTCGGTPQTRVTAGSSN